MLHTLQVPLSQPNEKSCRNVASSPSPLKWGVNLDLQSTHPEKHTLLTPFFKYGKSRPQDFTTTFQSFKYPSCRHFKFMISVYFSCFCTMVRRQGKVATLDKVPSPQFYCQRLLRRSHQEIWFKVRYRDCVLAIVTHVQFWVSQPSVPPSVLRASIVIWSLLTRGRIVV